jgi:hypothetical protein
VEAELGACFFGLFDHEAAVLAPGGSILLTLRGDASPATRADVERLEAKLDRLVGP